jgi:folate-binding protein YgfZ
MKYEIIDSRSLITISGVDAERFLQGLVTNLVCQSKPCYSLMLSAQGRYLCDFFLFGNDDGFYLSVINSAKARLLQKLTFYKLRSKVDIIDESIKYKHLYGNIPVGERSFKDPRHQQLGWWSILNISDIEKLDTRLISADLYNQDKYHLAIVDGDIDMLQDKALPPEYGIEILNGISYTKGCYIGQEVIARTKHLGEVRKKICLVTADCDLSNYHYATQITYKEQKIGILTSSYKNKAIALIRQNQEGEIPKIGYIDQQKILIQPATWYYHQ